MTQWSILHDILFTNFLNICSFSLRFLFLFLDPLLCTAGCPLSSNFIISAMFLNYATERSELFFLISFSTSISFHDLLSLLCF